MQRAGYNASVLLLEQHRAMHCRIGMVAIINAMFTGNFPKLELNATYVLPLVARDRSPGYGDADPAAKPADGPASGAASGQGLEWTK